jgi:putative nucleotidyltransferase with HDIG domain
LWNEEMANVTLASLIRNVEDLPSLPAVVMDLLNSVDQEDVDIDILAKKVAQDQALTGKTLRLANSSYFATQVKVTTIQQSITLLGFQNVRNLITTAALTGCFPERSCAGFDYKAFWCHSVTTASAASTLARQLGFNADYAFTAGLLHDIGRLVLITVSPKQYEQAIAHRAEHDCSMPEAEQEVFRIDHAQAGEILAAHWNFSDTLRLAIAGHHEPDLPGVGFLASIVHIASAIAEQLELLDEADQPTPSVSLTAWNALNLDHETYASIVEKSRQPFENVRRMIMA